MAGWTPDKERILKLISEDLDTIAKKVLGGDGPYDGDELLLRIEELVEPRGKAGPPPIDRAVIVVGPGHLGTALVTFANGLYLMRWTWPIHDPVATEVHPDNWPERYRWFELPRLRTLTTPPHP